MSIAGNAISRRIVSQCSINPEATVCICLKYLEKVFPFLLLILLILAINETVIKPKGNTLLKNLKDSLPFLIFVSGWPIFFFGLDFGPLLIIFGLLWMIVLPKTSIDDPQIIDYFHKQVFLHLRLYKQNKVKKTSKEIYSIVIDLAHKDQGNKYLLLLKKNFIEKNSSLNYRKIVRFVIISKIYESEELKGYFPNIVWSNLQLFIECALLSENVSVASKLIEKKFTNEEKSEFVNYLNEIISITDKYIPNEY